MAHGGPPDALASTESMVFDAIDWSRPWLAPLRSTAAPIIHAADWRAALNDAATERALRNHRGLPIRFVPQHELPPATAYEAFIDATGCVPTRDNLHDFFNALVWLAFPCIKAELNALQAMEIAKAGAALPQAGTPGRGRLRDAVTIFDENAALLIVRDTGLVDALRERRWRDVFVVNRHAFGRHCEVWPFGHALMEKLVRPYKAITAHAWPLVVDDAFFDMRFGDRRQWVDAAVARQLGEGLCMASFAPMPVLGVPGWSEGQDEAFYTDASVFRNGGDKRGEGMRRQ